ncbi:ankyrin repeat domain-containing protein [Luteibacter aegosomatissinici]|uniref:ankyrin repeat domain-containing protein n=1 Tax=Luteibacter aegosomatissinici TaxID=2911539 RepID=UPI003CCD84C5
MEAHMDLQLQRALCDAAWDGDAATVAALIKHPDVVPAAHHSTALVHAAHRGKLGCVRLLIPVSDPSARNAEPLWRAARYNRPSCVRALMGVSDTSGWEDWQWEELPVPMRRLLGRVRS